MKKTSKIIVVKINKKIKFIFEILFCLDIYINKVKFPAALHINKPHMIKSGENCRKRNK